MGARSMNLSLGLWLFLSSFLWPHSTPQLVNAWIVSILAVTAALAGLEGRHRDRYLNLALGVWLLLSSVLLPGTDVATAVNHVLVGAGLAAFASMERIGHAPV